MRRHSPSATTDDDDLVQIMDICQIIAGVLHRGKLRWQVCPESMASLVRIMQKSFILYAFNGRKGEQTGKTVTGFSEAIQKIN